MTVIERWRQPCSNGERDQAVGPWEYDGINDNDGKVYLVWDYFSRSH